MPSTYQIRLGSSDPLDQLYGYAILAYADRAGVRPEQLVGDSWRYLDQGGSAVLVSIRHLFDLSLDPAWIMSRAVRPQGASTAYVWTLPIGETGRLGGLSVRLDTLADFFPGLRRDAGVARWLAAAGGVSEAQIAQEAKSAAEQSDLQRRANRRADASAEEIRTGKAGDVVEAIENAPAVLGGVVGRVAGAVVSTVGTVAGTGAAAAVGALPPSFIVAVGVLTVAAAVYVVRNVTR